MKKKSHPCPKSYEELMELYYLDARSFLLETASTLDRLERVSTPEKLQNDKRIRKLFKACDIIKECGNGNRSEKFLNLFSGE